MVEHLFEALGSETDPGFAVVEAWSLDAPQHGHAASLNAHLLLGLSDGLSRPLDSDSRMHTCSLLERHGTVEHAYQDLISLWFG